MLPYLQQLEAVLREKVRLLQTLADKQDAFKQFLVAPVWSKLAEFTQPQEGLLQRLRQINQQQAVILERLAAQMRVGPIPNLKTLCRFVDDGWSSKLRELIQAIALASARLRRVSRLSQRLSQAQWRFAQESHAKAGGARVAQATYNAHGYAAAKLNYNSSLVREA